MLPTISIGGTSVSSYAVMILLGALGMLAYIWYKRRKYGLRPIPCIVFTVLLTLCGIGGAKLLYILESLPDVLENGLSSGGVSFFGSVYLIPLVMPLIGRLFRMDAKQTQDLCAPCVAIMIAFIRIGCLLCGCCGGWVMYIGKIYFTWPTQIMECIGDIGLFFWLMRREKRGQKEGTLYPLFMLGYSGLRFIIEYFRYTPDTWLGISHGHWFTFIAALAGALWLKALSGNRTTGDQHEK